MDTDQWNKTTLTDHYNKLAVKYDLHYELYYRAVVSAIEKHGPKFEDEDLVADIGSGTGEIAHRIWKNKKLKNPILCVEPSGAMVDLLRTKEGVEAVQATAEDYLSSQQCDTRSKPLDKIILCGSAHHFSDSPGVFKNLFGLLSENGACIAVLCLSYSGLFKTALDLLRKDNTKLKDNLIDVFKTLNVNWSEKHHTYVYTVSKEECYAALRDRFFSVLEQLTDDEIKMGIEELEVENRDKDMVELSIEICLVTVVL